MLSFVRIGLIGRYRSPNQANTLENLWDFLLRQGCQVCLDSETAEHYQRQDLPHLDRQALVEHADLIIVIGGDGSLLNAARSAAPFHKPVLGINRGQLGFLADIHPEEFHLKLPSILQGQYQQESRFLLKMSLWLNETCLAEHLALNDVVMMPGALPQLIEFDTYVDNRFMCNQRADGIIITTPTGSTAYALSGGGPILHPQLDAIALVPVFPHKLSSRPIVVQGSAQIKICINPENQTAPTVSCDSQARESIPVGGHLIIEKYPDPLQLIHPLEYNYFETLRNKLGWEEGS